MKLYVNQKLLSNEYYFCDKNETKEYEFILDEKQISIYDNKHSKFGYIKNNKIYINDKLLFILNINDNEYHLVNSNYIITNLLNITITIKSETGKEIAIIKKKTINVGEKYQVEIIDTDNINIIIAIITSIISNLELEDL